MGRVLFAENGDGDSHAHEAAASSPLAPPPPPLNAFHLAGKSALVVGDHDEVTRALADAFAQVGAATAIGDLEVGPSRRRSPRHHAVTSNHKVTRHHSV